MGFGELHAGYSQTEGFAVALDEDPVVRRSQCKAVVKGGTSVIVPLLIVGQVQGAVVLVNVDFKAFRAAGNGGSDVFQAVVRGTFASGVGGDDGIWMIVSGNGLGDEFHGNLPVFFSSIVQKSPKSKKNAVIHRKISGNTAFVVSVTEKGIQNNLQNDREGENQP
ncbi:MAG: hypothetical protein IKI93_15785 [Clostridia bacterium]|nr:hypothetical protein [Clostridia bacterium]